MDILRIIALGIVTAASTYLVVNAIQTWEREKRIKRITRDTLEKMELLEKAIDDDKANKEALRQIAKASLKFVRETLVTYNGQEVKEIE